MADSLVSIVVPVYNVEQYVADCLDSIAAQTYANYEVIIVDDGTPDRSADICREWIAEHKDTRFKLICKPNSGVSDARNFGLEHCSENAEYVVFIDSDDELTPDCLDTLMRYASDDTLVVGSLLRCYKERVAVTDDAKCSVIRFEDIWHNYQFIDSLKSGMINSSCANCYSLKVIRSMHIRFKKQFPEDTFFNYEYLSAVSTIVHIEKPIYLYYIRENSITTKPREEIYINYMKLQQLLCSKVGDKYSAMIDRFVYPQYRVNTMNFLKRGEYSLPRKYLGADLVKRSMASYKPVSIADWAVHFCLRHHLLSIAKHF